MQTVTAHHDDGIEWLELDSPPVNALSAPMVEQLITALDRCAQDDGVRVVVLGGRGRHFCAGADLREQRDGTSGAADLGPRLYAALLGFPKPIIAMAHGAVAGAGLSIVSCCDVALAATGTRISLPEIDVGVLGGTSHARTRLSTAMVGYLALTGEPVRVERLGGATPFLEVVEPGALRERVAAVARTIARKDPVAARYTKWCLRETQALGQLAGYEREHELSQELRASGVTARLVDAFLDR